VDTHIEDVPASSGPLGEGGVALGSPEALEKEAGQQGAFNEETGEINWDCPCLGGMADGPCGENFKEAFSCFVFSKEEPKGVDCIDKFK
jgi:intermembrane space import and assembly protein 40